ncbi:class II aldolase/adducin family protein [Naasia lichenicola]|uniref:Class II aldolase n=1 Tax=Naasia lichenicola TaxID=2565933 RepID=A0A4S4FGH7_9MICO|nr:class II aldolase/adducin family protein [Naasia lichenicola]THG29323.1 class II aldolase [Naasia lichenicola]
MATRWDPALVDDELLELSLSLGDPAKDLVILAEGNASKRLDDDAIVIKTSGSYLSRVTSADFVVTEIEAIMAVVDDESATQADLSAILDAGEHGGAPRKASIETLVHAAVHSIAPAVYVAHTHPTPVVALLASVHAATTFDEWVYSDEAVVIGQPLFVPYAEPGLALGRIFAKALRTAVDERGEAPSLILLGNHGLVARANTAEAAEAITLMAVKGAKIRLAALSAGGVVGLGKDTVDHYFLREDMTERRQRLAGM